MPLGVQHGRPGKVGRPLKRRQQPPRRAVDDAALLARLGVGPRPRLHQDAVPAGSDVALLADEGEGGAYGQVGGDAEGEGGGRGGAGAQVGRVEAQDGDIVGGVVVGQFSL